MAIEKNSFKGSRFDHEFSPNSKENTSSDEEEVQRRVSADESDDDDDEFDDADSGAGSDDFDLLELGETGAEFCQIGNSTCSVPFELYDLSGLEDILSVDVWNEVLTDEERFSLTKYLPDLDQETYMTSVKELLEGQNFHFGSPVKMLFEMLTGGLCEPRVALYREGLKFFQKRQHYHLLRKHQNAMVSNLCQMRDAGVSCRGYSIEEKLKVLNIMNSENNLMYENMEEGLASDLSEEELSEGQWVKKAKDRKSAAKLGHYSLHGVGSSLEIPTRLLPSRGLEVAKYGKQNPKGILKFSGTLSKEMEGWFPSVYQGMDVNSRPYGLPLPTSHQKVMGYESGLAVGLRDQMRIDDDGGGADDFEGATYGVGIQRDPNMAHRDLMDKSGVLKVGKKNKILRSDELASGSFSGFPVSLKNDVHAYGRTRNANKLLEVEAAIGKVSNLRSSQEFGKKTKYPENVQQFDSGDQMKMPKGWAQQMKGSRASADLSENGEPIWHNNNQEHAFSVDSSRKSNDRSFKRKNWKAGSESPDLNLKTYGSSSPPMNDRILLSELRSKPSQEKIRGSFVQNGRPAKRTKKMNRMYARNEETEFDEEEEDNNLLTRRKFSYPTVNPPSVFLKAGPVSKKGKFVKKAMQDSPLAFDGMTQISKKVGSCSELGRSSVRPSRSKQKDKMHDSSPLHSSCTKALENSSHFGLSKVKGDNMKRSRKLLKKGQLQEPGEMLPISSLKAYPFDRKQKGEGSRDYAFDEEDDSLETRLLADENAVGRFGKKGQDEAYFGDRRDRSDASLGFNSLTKKRKAREELTDIDVRDEDVIFPFNGQQQMDESVSLKKNGKRKVVADTGTSDMEINGPPVTEIGAVDRDIETKLQKKPYTPITPSVHTGFSFSVIHLLSAVRMAMISPLAEESLEAGKSDEQQNGKHEANTNGVVPLENADAGKSDSIVLANVPSLTVLEIVNRVRSNPGDPCILETQEPLQDLVRGVLKIFASKAAPLGAKSWKSLVVYEKSTKSWSWIGPMTQFLTDHDSMEEVTSPEYWGLPHKMLVKLVDSFANWLKSGQETLQQIGVLPAPPVSLMQANLDEKERFRDLRAQKSLHTINPSCEEVRAYFRKEELLRYSIPDRAFSYTAADGKKSIVAPLRRCGGKPTSKARDHFMLKRDRPPHVTILCLVRDAAARLPGSIGTRADVCTLIRDSQYIVEDVSDAQVNQVVSGALDRLHYERDPCVQFDGDRKLWVYLHREREEEDFEDDGTSSTKKWKRQKKDPGDQPERGSVAVAFQGNVDQSGFDLGSDLNVEPPGTDEDKRKDFAYDDVKKIADDNAETSHVLEPGTVHQGHPMVWDTLSLNPMRENKLLCQENSANEDFDDETFGRERPVGLLSASCL